jgi:hypothetical protein
LAQALHSYLLEHPQGVASNDIIGFFKPRIDAIEQTTGSKQIMYNFRMTLRRIAKLKKSKRFGRGKVWVLKDNQR